MYREKKKKRKHNMSKSNSSLDPIWFQYFINDTPFPVTYEAIFEQAYKTGILYLIVAAIWILVYYLLDTFYPRFQKISPTHKKWYVIANVSKSFFLSIALTGPHTGIFPSWQLHHDYALRLDYHSFELCRRWATWYVCTDFLALIFVPKLPYSTKMHHIITVAFLLILWCTDISDSQSISSQITRCIDVYGYWSAYAFSVNLFLALRVLYDQNSFGMVIIRLVSFVAYTVCCLCNWLWQVREIYRAFLLKDFPNYDHLWIVLYGIGLFFICKDDVILMKWLLYPTRKKIKKEV
jgi:hypothetical protein